MRSRGVATLGDHARAARHASVFRLAATPSSFSLDPRYGCRQTRRALSPQGLRGVGWCTFPYKPSRPSVPPSASIHELRVGGRAFRQSPCWFRGVGTCTFSEQGASFSRPPFKGDRRGACDEPGGWGLEVVACVHWVFSLLARGLAGPPSREDGRIGSLKTDATSWIEAEGGREKEAGIRGVERRIEDEGGGWERSVGDGGALRFRR